MRNLHCQHYILVKYLSDFFSSLSRYDQVRLYLTLKFVQIVAPGEIMFFSQDWFPGGERKEVVAKCKVRGT